jgi:hypothetical protein
MDIVYPCCAGLDVHKDTVVVTVRCRHADGSVRQWTRSYGTMTAPLLELADWLASHGVSHLAMESTGVYWKPIWNLLEDQFQILLVNAQPLKQVPGRKTDVKDSVWIAQLLLPDALLAALTDHGMAKYDPLSGWQAIGGSGTIASVSSGLDGNGRADVYAVLTNRFHFLRPERRRRSGSLCNGQGRRVARALNQGRLAEARPTWLGGQLQRLLERPRVRRHERRISGLSRRRPGGVDDVTGAAPLDP